MVTLVDGEERADAIVKTHIENELQSNDRVKPRSRLLKGHTRGHIYSALSCFENKNADWIKQMGAPGNMNGLKR